VFYKYFSPFHRLKCVYYYPVRGPVLAQIGKIETQYLSVNVSIAELNLEIPIKKALYYG
jgi:hypothetical protein